MNTEREKQMLENYERSTRARYLESVIGTLRVELMRHQDLAGALDTAISLIEDEMNKLKDEYEKNQPIIDAMYEGSD